MKFNMYSFSMVWLTAIVAVALAGVGLGVMAGFFLAFGPTGGVASFFFTVVLAFSIYVGFSDGKSKARVKEHEKELKRILGED